MRMAAATEMRLNETALIACMVQVLFQRNQHSHSRKKLDTLADLRNTFMSENIIMHAW